MRDELSQKLKDCRGILGRDDFLPAIARGLAFHHSGLSNDERVLVEDGYRSGAISVLVATTTLAAGVNLPAGCVLINSMRIGQSDLGLIQYKQMSGRAGRTGQGTTGNSTLLVKSNEREKAFALITGKLPDVQSQMAPDNDASNALMKALLEMIFHDLCGTVSDINVYVRNTLLYRQLMEFNRQHFIEQYTVSVLNFLHQSKIIVIPEQQISLDSSNTINLNSGNTRLRVTRLGRAMIQSSIDPDEAIVLYDSLLKAQEGLNLESSLHLLYLVTPLDHRIYPNFKKLLNVYTKAQTSKSTTLANIIDSIGITEEHLQKWQAFTPSHNDCDICSSAVRLHSLDRVLQPAQTDQNNKNTNAMSEVDSGNKSTNTSKFSKEDWMVICACKRLWAANLLERLIMGHSIEQVAREFDVEYSTVETLLNSCYMMSYRVERFCREVGWHALGKIIK